MFGLRLLIHFNEYNFFKVIKNDHGIEIIEKPLNELSNERTILSRFCTKEENKFFSSFFFFFTIRILFEFGGRSTNYSFRFFFFLDKKVSEY